MDFWDFLLENWIWCALFLISLVAIIVILIILFKKPQVTYLRDPNLEEPQAETNAENNVNKKRRMKRKMARNQAQVTDLSVQEIVPEKNKRSMKKALKKGDSKGITDAKSKSNNSQSNSKPRKKVKGDKMEKQNNENKDELNKPLNQKYMVTYNKEEKSWIVRKTGNARITRRCATKQEALDIAKQLSKNQELNLTVQKRDGKFQKKSNI